MKGIIEKISRIDAIAFENEQKNKSILNSEQQRYESNIRNYRDQKLKAAESNGKNMYDQIINKAKTECQLEEKKVKKVRDNIESNYMRAEKVVMDKVLKKLFDD